MAHDPSADHPSATTPYPLLDARQRAALAGALEQIVALRLRHPLTDHEMTEIRSVIGAQIADTERLHAFPLANEDEPAFVMPATGGGAW